MAVHFIVDDQSNEVRYLCPVTKQTVSGTYFNDTWTTIANDECRLGEGWFQYTFYGTGVEIAASTSIAEEDFYVKIDNEPWVMQHGRGRYESPPLSDGLHTVSYAAGQLVFPILDYLVVKAGYTTPLQDRNIIVDNVDTSITYNGAWTTEAIPPIILDSYTTSYHNITHWSTTVGDTFQFQFTGSSLTIFGTFINISFGQTFLATYTVDDVPITEAMPMGTLDGMPMTQLFSTEVTGGNHTVLVNITQISPPLSVGFDFLTYDASFASLESMPGYAAPSSSSHRISAAAIAGGVIGVISFIGAMLLLIVLLRKRYRKMKQKDGRMDREGWSELK
ncbi:hypothetical protein FPV67DRAFT_761104 [Lyophyllum atratum]|nr:hypothetical protein FPV67DRAFT_761104 [Lyophyllum atratum]